MRKPRQLVPAEAVGLYHVLSRVVDRRLVFEDAEKAQFRKFLLAYAEFSGIEVLAWCLMGNHFHLLLRVPPQSSRAQYEVPDHEVVRRVAIINGHAVANHLANLLALCGTESSRRELLAPYRKRMGDLGLMMKSLKQRFTQWFNRGNDRKGTLWEERYRSYIVRHEEDAPSSDPEVPVGLGEIARIVAAYIDANPMRAGIVKDPAGYRWCGFGDAVAGSPSSRSALARLWGLPESKAISYHREMMLHRGGLRLEPEVLSSPDKMRPCAPEAV